ncbi:hypothetical protein CXG81DRAFT_11111 [Caulochytrium protostelioides]|uniref:non-specific serine/threonine protein kinase n=1 Tax=Caulochytrium protostelioides TaxID=1555241 RepID=A0A4P9WZQ4_9FUNG|nr:kinase-like protein [Caulochytrium protostelioides]RKP02186.1 hypothetical protein CXG81DRAFT_11111 [Caulochytrium protostelioides]|eukprot:RKP02186.1 hypothetical protein CXG81DRAFT_11111 [Caulochytrium protostelioides]
MHLGAPAHAENTPVAVADNTSLPLASASASAAPPATTLSPPGADTLRKCELSKLFFLDHYFDLLTYLDARKARLAAFKRDMAARTPPPSSGADVLATFEQEQEAAWRYFCGKERAHLRKRRTRLRLSNFELVRQIGQGGYGQVFLARKRDTDEWCAVKKMNKHLLHRLHEVQHILTERDILTRVGSPWLVKLLYAFQDMESVYLAMEYVPGGDMRTLLNNSGVLRQEHARLYVAEMLTAADQIHRLGYIHRDIKPENFLIDASGHLKLTDFGLSRGKLCAEEIAYLQARLETARQAPLVHRTVKERWQIYQSIQREEVRAFSLVGSPDYMAPEVLQDVGGRGYDHAVDYWSVGCILFECLAGFPPFAAASSDEVWRNVYHWETVLERPVYTGADAEFNFTDEAWDLVTRLLCHAPQRLAKLADVKPHAFFSGLPAQWEQLRADATNPLSRGVTPPFVPRVADPRDTRYFDNFEDPKDMAMYKEVHARQAAHKEKEGASASDGTPGAPRSAFIGFTFKHSGARSGSI